jgi:hypothetical protein
LITSKFLALVLPFHGWKGPEIAWGEFELNFVVGLEKVDQWNIIRTSAIQSRSCLMQFLGFSSHEKGALRQEFQSDQWSAASFQEVGGAL